MVVHLEAGKAVDRHLHLYKARRCRFHALADRAHPSGSNRKLIAFEGREQRIPKSSIAQFEQTILCAQPRLPDGLPPRKPPPPPRHEPSIFINTPLPYPLPPKPTSYITSMLMKQILQASKAAQTMKRAKE
ncbi:hypothetical protein BD779DRAFT_1479892 [Infundibulicybe gibba]|nr:hypothetical protein BD779DRAFT_1479892 [Infundibulicybe gibba]